MGRAGGAGRTRPPHRSCGGGSNTGGPDPVAKAEDPFLLAPPFDTLPPAGQLDSVFMNGACARSTSITTGEAAAYRYGANIHNQGECVICAGESRLLAGRQLKLAPAAMAEITADNRVSPPPARGPALALPAFDERRYGQLPPWAPPSPWADRSLDRAPGPVRAAGRRPSARV